MNECIETINYKDFDIKIYQDEYSESPREWENLGTMICFHKRYNLGDKHNINSDNFNGWNELHDYIKKELNGYIILPLRLYDHSGISISTSTGYPYNCQWDSGQVGFIYITKEKILKEYSKKIVSKQLKEKVTQYLISEVKTYDDYLTGQIYGYQIEDNEGEDIDSCYGYYGYDHKASSLLESAENAIDCHIADIKEKHYKQLKKWINKKIPLQYRKPLVIN